MALGGCSSDGRRRKAGSRRVEGEDRKTRLVKEKERNKNEAEKSNCI
jgi:hypothetical protein